MLLGDSGKMIVLHVLAMSSYSGAENVVCQIIKMFSGDRDIRMIYCSPDGPIRKVLEEKNIEFEPIAKLSVPELSKVIRKIKPDIVHAHDVRATVYSALCCDNAMLVSHMHNNWEDLRKMSLKGIIYLLATKKTSKIIWVSDSAFRQYRYSDRLKKKSVILKNIIDVEQIRNTAEQNLSEIKYDIVNVGRLTYQKNPERLIRIIDKMVKKNPGLKVGLIGDGELAETIKCMVREKNLEPNVEMLGYVGRPLGIIKNAKAFLLVSRWEGTPMVVLEALALGVPVVGTPVDGMLDLVQDGKNGFLSVNDDEIADHLANIISDSNLHDNLSKEAMERSEIRNSVADYKLVLKNVYKERLGG